MTLPDWQPGASLDALRARAELYRSLRAFFDARGYIEVDTPVLSQTAVSDPHIDSIAAGQGWLQSSPEYAMKRILAAGSGPIYQIAHAFRDDECGRWHNREFSLLEWYVPGYDHHALMDEVEALLRHLLGESCGHADFKRLRYRDCFLQQLAIDPFTADSAQLAACASQQGLDVEGELGRDGWLDLLMGQCIGPELGLKAPCFIYDYPASQAALARLSDKHPDVACRFELYWQGLELANGYHELCDADEQRQRFDRDLDKRRELGKLLPRPDARLLAALEAGMPDCAGVALGLDRLLALKLGLDDMAGVLSFPADRA